jgi:hypothetical protein
MSEDRLRDLLRHAVPEAPRLDAAAIERRAATVQRKRRATVVGAAAVLVVAVGVWSIGGPGGIGDDGGPRDDFTAPSPTADSFLTPYDVARCPARLPEPGSGNRAVAGLDDIVAVRLCPEFDPRRHEGWTPSPDNLAALDDADALVHGVDSFVTHVRALPTGLPDHCGGEGDSYVGQAFALHRTDGTQVLLSATGCELVTIDGRTVDGGALLALYLEALDGQRDDLDYTRPFDDELTCVTSQRGGPVRPGREHLVAAVVCDVPPGAESLSKDVQPTPLSPEQLASLNKAWAHPGAPVIREGNEPHACLDLGEPPSFIIAATDRSDVVQLLDSPCGFLVWHGGELMTDASRGATLPVTLQDLGVVPR